MNDCKYRFYDGAFCNRGTAKKTAFCAYHQGITCEGCKGAATHQCGEVVRGAIYCGAPLCDECKHKLDKDRVGHWTHAKKGKVNL